MSRINTNVSSLNAQKVLVRSNTQLQQALTRLSTGLRINSGKDDPAGLIAAEVLQSDIVSTGRAITNSERANQMIATADSALGQVSNLLNDIRALIAEAANGGTMSQDQIAANQLQIDASLDAIDRIAHSTEFQGRRLLDGSLDFVTHGVDYTRLTDLQISEANFGNQTEISVAINVNAQATRGQLNYAFGAIAEDVALEIGGEEGYEAFNFSAGTTIEDMAAAINLVSDSMGVYAEVARGATAGTITASSASANSDIVLQAKIPGGETGNYRIKFVADPLGGALGVTHVAPVGETPGTITVDLETEAWAKATVTVDDTSSTDNGLIFTANVDGTVFNGVAIEMADNGLGVGGFETVAYDHATNTLSISVASGVTTAQQVVDALAADPKVSKLFSASITPDSSGLGTIDVTNAAWIPAPTLADGVDGGSVLSTANDVVAAMEANVGLNELVQVDLAAGNNGYGIVSPFEEYTFYGVPEANNRLQFLAPAGTAKIRFVSEPDQELGVDLTTDPPVEDYSSAVVQGTAENTSIVLVAQTRGAEYDGVSIRYHDRGTDAQDSVVYRPMEKVVDVYVDQGTATAQTVVDLINNDSYVSTFFRAENYGSSTGASVIDNADYDVDLATTAGGVTSEGTILINLATDEDGLITTTAQDLIDYFKSDANAPVLGPLGISISNAEESNGSGLLAATTDDLVFATAGTDMEDVPATATLAAVNGTDALVEITADIAGAEFGNVRVVFENTAAAAGLETAAYDPASKTLTIGIFAGGTTADQAIAAINTNPAVSLLFTAERGTDRSGVTGSGLGLVTTSDGGTLSAGVVNAGTEDGASFLGNADRANTGLSFLSTEYGSDAFVSVKSIGGGEFVVTNPLGDVVTRSTGTDIDLTVNGVQAVGHRLQATVNTATLDMTFSVAETMEDGESTAFTIIGGGAQFQLGTEVGSSRVEELGSSIAQAQNNVIVSQQARLGIVSINTAKLGGVSGRLSDLQTGGSKSLESDIFGAGKVVEEAMAQITTLRGRLGAFQKTTLETNVNTLSDTLENLTQAESTIRDADFAAETAALTRAQILVQSGVSVLGIANSTPEMALELLRGL